MLIRKSRVRLISMVPGARNGRKLVPLPPLFFFFYQETFQGTFSSLWCLFFSFIFWMTFLLTSTWCSRLGKSSIHFLSSSFFRLVSAECWCLWKTEFWNVVIIFTFIYSKMYIPYLPLNWKIHSTYVSFWNI